MTIIIEEGGLFSSFQDFGRVGYEHLGVIRSGALDVLAHEIANRLVGNDKNEATLEMTNQMARIRFTEPTLIALSGAQAIAHTQDMRVKINTLYLMNKGDVLSFDHVKRGARVYMAIAGGYEVDQWLGSTSTDIISQMGGFHGHTLKDGDEIQMKRDYNDRHHKLFENLEVTRHTDWGVDGYALSFNYLSDVVHVIPNKGTEDFDDNILTQFTRGEYCVTSKANRMGIVLEGAPIKAYYNGFPPHRSVKRGTIQVKKDGSPIVLLNDHYTLGSYPQIGTIATYHLTKIAQKRQGSKIKFQFIDVLQAEQNLVKYHKWIKQLFHGIEYRMQSEMLK
ncbi:biotin-dependent carboxyltransferase family protein [Staphylococcus hyicus]|uniref:Biotin-dependent carboxyltransferase family protein n=2 Tax=Staphylococcus hyicus TaxID=1284 RepID=A0ACD5FK90_STAHY|nr:biotin-dependent carboxyltransferase family protein [Staphylococcus hyicus]AJC96756.1 allophanate hydrolase subunit 2 [Staphylococcus hyicus]MCQ9290099.1 biotin-dependent carboxyltransferase family protein [Staphylococcus hyicus]MCQ9305340.1 biotin-dependent carboxyltransferase family protein [Staphylococcus hyicus]MCQ9307752.1 biotin-dependent carboxyltransferase family protein [Staphylococcus hyicus]MCQ9310175.1 biotin-dependent carboxyltransferase family protein [Staphylococcus hyicus]